MKSMLFGGVCAVALALMPASAEVDCLRLSLAVKQALAADSSKVLEVVAKEVAAAPGCACEIVKAAIEGVRAKPQTVAAIVEAAITVAPEHMRLISQCAVAVAPDALAEVQAVLAKFQPRSGSSSHSAKDAKDAKKPLGEVAAMPNPLDFPGTDPTSPIVPVFPVFPPIIINPPETTKL